jgi:hypothetical protein
MNNSVRQILIDEVKTVAAWLMSDWYVYIL